MNLLPALGVDAPRSSPHAPPTLLVAPPACLEHRTYAEPYVRGDSDVPPENVERLRILTQPGRGILYSTEFGSRVAWCRDSPLAPLADVTKVHDWAYLRKVKAACSQVANVPSAIGHLDGDTAISHATFVAALAGAGAVTHAIDQVCVCLGVGVGVPLLPRTARNPSSEFESRKRVWSER